MIRLRMKDSVPISKPSLFSVENVPLYCYQIVASDEIYLQYNKKPLNM